jgi:hypothetical protein
MHIRRKASRGRTRLTAIAVIAGTAAFTVLGVAGPAGAASAAPRAPAAPLHHQHRPCLSVRLRTSGNFMNDQNILTGWIVPGSVSVVANQGTGGINPPVDTFGPGTGYTVSSDWHTVSLQSPYAGSNDGFVTHYAVFIRTRHFGCHFKLRTLTSGNFMNNQNILKSSNIVFGSVFVVANLGQTPGANNPPVNGFAQGNGYTVAYMHRGATVTLQSPYAGSNDGFVTYYTVFSHHR